MTERFDLAVVMPVYNEQECICQVVDSWHSELAGLGINFQMLVLNDGSRDQTGLKLASYVDNPRIEVINKPNSGHGPTILKGYRMAVNRAEWVFQTDSDDEMSPSKFKELWAERGEYKALFGFRSGRQQNLGRQIISAVSRLAVRILFGRGIVDVNTPYRLMHGVELRKMVNLIPADTFAPNILISGMFAASGAPIMNHPVPHEGRKSGQVSIVKWRLWRAAARSLRQTIAFRIDNAKEFAPK